MIRSHILRGLLLVVALFAVSADARTPLGDWVDSKEKKLAEVLADVEAGKKALCGMQTNTDNRSECIAAFESIRRHDAVLEFNLSRIRKLDNVKNPELRAKLITAENAAYNSNVATGTALLLAVGDTFKTNLAAR